MQARLGAGGEGRSYGVAGTRGREVRGHDTANGLHGPAVEDREEVEPQEEAMRTSFLVLLWSSINLYYTHTT